MLITISSFDNQSSIYILNHQALYVSIEMKIPSTIWERPSRRWYSQTAAATATFAAAAATVAAVVAAAAI